jgi:hypothetical protein
MITENLRYPRKARSENENFHIAQSALKRVRKRNEHPRITFHGTADVAQKDERTRLDFWLAPEQPRWFSAASERRSHNSAHIQHSRTASGFESTRPSPGDLPFHFGDQSPNLN